MKLYTLFRAEREAKNHTLSSGTSPYRPYKGVSPPRGGGGFILQKVGSAPAVWASLTQVRLYLHTTQAQRILPATAHVMFIFQSQAQHKCAVALSQKPLCCLLFAHSCCQGFSLSQTWFTVEKQNSQPFVHHLFSSISHTTFCTPHPQIQKINVINHHPHTIPLFTVRPEVAKQHGISSLRYAGMTIFMTVRAVF